MTGRNTQQIAPVRERFVSMVDAVQETLLLRTTAAIDPTWIAELPLRSTAEHEGRPL